MTISGRFERFQYFDFETNLLGKENLFQKTGVFFLVDSTKTESASFSYKTALSEANAKTNRMENTKCTYHKERSFARNYFIFLEILLQLKNLL